MFETAELGQKVTREQFDVEEGPLRDSLLEVQQQLAEARTAVIIIVGGVDGAGKGETVNLLMEWMDPRGVQVNALVEPTEEERDRPSFWRYWMHLPRRGKIGIYLGSWYTEPIVSRVYKRIRPRELEDRIGEIQLFERMLADDGALILKFWLHLSKKAQRKRLERLESDPLTRWRVEDEDWKNFKRYDSFYQVSEDVLRRTSSGRAPWHVVEAGDHHYRHLTVARIVRDRIRQHIQEKRERKPADKAAPTVLPAAQKGVLSSLDYSSTVAPEVYDVELEKLQGRLNLLSREVSRKKLSVVVAFEGSDAAGKGGNVRRITHSMDARHYQVIPISAPTDEERAHPYMWRFWRQLPRSGQITIFDRSWYGRVLVEPIEGFCTEDEWQRAYAEINDFEEHLSRHGTLVVKFWLAITKEEQLRRFKEREEVSFKRFKITPDDWRNREKWELYEALVHQMVERTSTSVAPWTLVPGNDKHYARLATLSTLCDWIEERL